MAENHLKKCSMSLVIGEMQIKTILKFYLTPIRMAKVRISRDSTCYLLMWSKGNTHPLQVGVKTCTTTLEINLELSEKTGNFCTIRSSYTTPVNLTKNVPPCSKDICLAFLIAVLFVTDRNWKQYRYLSSE